MGIDAFVLRYEIEELGFTELFLASGDFDIATLRNICRTLHLPPSGKRTDLIHRITMASKGSAIVQRMIIQHLIGRKKSWATLKTGKDFILPDCLDPRDLVISAGEEQWYGPINYPPDSDASWYIRPMFLPHWEILEGPTEPPRRVWIRWLCFARIGTNSISLHWRGFSYAKDQEYALRYNAQFRYWEHVLTLFDEIEKLTHASLAPVDLHDLILHKLWDEYRYAESYEWIDRRIRAESGGVSLSARAGAVVEIEIGGIRRLANTIRKSIQLELNTKYETSLPEPDKFDEVILRTLIREFGTLSYEFSLADNDGSKLFRAHTYFGLKPKTSSPDAFPHLKFHTSWRDDKEQFQFLLDHLRMDDDNESQPEQILLF